jgi:hypothetical protein
MPATLTTSRTPRYQEGSLALVARAKGPDVWVYRWRELDDNGKRVQRKLVIGNVDQFPTKSDAKREVENLRREVNAQHERPGMMTVGDAWGHFQANELYDPHKDRSATSIDRYLEVFKRNILPNWKDAPLDEVKTVKVEKWLRGLDLANGTKAKIRNTFCVLFNHRIRHELYDKNPISGPSKGSGVRQSGLHRRDPDILTTAEMASVLAGIGSEAIKVMVDDTATTGRILETAGSTSDLKGQHAVCLSSLEIYAIFPSVRLTFNRLLSWK